MHRFGPVWGLPRRDLWWYGFGHVIFTVVLVALAVALAVWLTNSQRRRSSAPPANPLLPPPGTPPVHPMPPGFDAALNEARMRYARGELSREDFLRISEDLGGPAT